jgi:hypothetical protein
MGFLISIVLAVACVAIAFYFLDRLPKEEFAANRRWFWKWVCKGFAIPLLVWVLLNSGRSPWLVSVTEAKIAGKPAWFPVLMNAMLPAVLIVGSYWLAVTFGWWVARLISARREDWADYKSIVIFWSMFSIPAAATVLFLSGLWGMGFALLVAIFPIAHNLLAVTPGKKLPPTYSQAVAKIKFGRYAEAEMEIIGQLENCQEDFDGWMMLAELYARRFNDVAEAEATVHDICKHPKTNPAQISIALHRLADWQMEIAQDPAAARRSLEIICKGFPGSHLAKMARLRIERIPKTKEAFIEQQRGIAIHLPEASHELDDELADGPTLDVDEATRQANQCVAKLNHEPNNALIREQLARLLAEPLGQVELGIEQLGSLLDMPDQPENKKAEWLALIAAWHLKFNADPERAKIFMERLVAEYPHTPQAFAAQRKLNLLKRV